MDHVPLFWEEKMLRASFSKLEWGTEKGSKIQGTKIVFRPSFFDPLHREIFFEEIKVIKILASCKNWGTLYGTFSDFQIWNDERNSFLFPSKDRGMKLVPEIWGTTKALYINVDDCWASFWGLKNYCKTGKIIKEP